MSEIHKLLYVSDTFNEVLTELVPPALIESFSEPTPTAIKALAIKKVLEKCQGEHEPTTYALIGLMVEQAYNAAVLQSTRKPLFKKT